MRLSIRETGKVVPDVVKRYFYKVSFIGKD